jgi:choline dehydrogenase
MPYITFADLLQKGDNAKDHYYFPTKFDFIIVGAGSAGCPLASRLSEDLSVTVLLIEAGPRFHGLEETINAAIPAAAGKVQHTTLDWSFYTEPQAPLACTRMFTYPKCDPYRKHRSYWPRGKGLGGSSLINYMAWVRGHADDYNQWEAVHGAKGWGWNVIGKLFQERIEDISSCDATKLCANCRFSSKNSNNSNSNSNGSRSWGPYGISHKKPINPLTTCFVDACSDLGFQKGDYNCGCSSKSTTTTNVVGIHQNSVRQGTRCTSARAYIDPLLMSTERRRPNLTVLTGANCKRVVTKTDETGHVIATGVVVVPDGDNNNNNIAAIEISCGKEIILSAGALGSPQILLQSGIGPNGDVVKLSQVGRNLQDHLVVHLRFPPKLGQGNQDIGSITAYKAEAPQYLFANFYQMLFRHEGLLTSPAYDASVFYRSSTSVETSSSSTGLARPNLQISCLCATADEQLLVDTIGYDFESHELDKAEFSPKAEGLIFCCTLLQPKSRGYVTLNNDTADNKNHGLAIHAKYLTDPKGQDVKEMIGCIRQALRIARAKPFQELINPIPLVPKDTSRKHGVPCHDDVNATVPPVEDIPDAFFEEIIRRHAATLYHPASTCRMGPNADVAVVDYTLKVFGVQGLRIADAAIQPEVVSGNTQASCVVIGERAADIIREEYGLANNPLDLLDAVAHYEGAIRRTRWTIFIGGILVTAGVLGAVAMRWRRI